MAGHQKGSLLFGTFAGSGQQGVPAYTVMRELCAKDCDSEFAIAREARACADACQATAVLLLNEQK